MRPPSFAILCVGRVGSEHLVSLLDSHPGITCFGELFAPSWGAGKRRATTPVPRFFESDHDDPWTYWTEVTAGLTGQLLGLKLPHSSLESHPRSRELLDSSDVRIIRLRRANRVAQYVSVVIAAESGVWQSTDGTRRTQTIRVDPAKCVEALQGITRSEAELDRLAAGHPCFELTYEVLADGKGLEEIQAFLGVAPQPLSSPYERLRTLPLQDVVENYGELVEALAETPFADDL